MENDDIQTAHAEIAALKLDIKNLSNEISSIRSSTLAHIKSITVNISQQDYKITSTVSLLEAKSIFSFEESRGILTP